LGLIAVAVLDGDLDVGEVTPLRRAVLREDAELAGEGLGIGEGVPDVGVPRHESQRLLLAAAADEDRDAAGRCRVELRPAGLDARQRLAECVDARARRAELVAVLGVVLLEPAGTCAEDEAPGSRA